MTDQPASAGAQPRAMFFASTSAPALLRGPAVAYNAEDGGSGGGFSVEDAVAFLDGLPDEQDAPAAAPAAAEPPAAEVPSESEGAASAPEEAAGAAETQAGEADQGADAQRAETPLEAPLYWKPEAKAKFALLDPELQAEILAQEGPRETAAAKVKEDAAQVRSRADAELAAVQQLSEQLGKLVPDVLKRFGDKWGQNPDWVAYASTHGADKMAVAKAAWEADRAQVQQLQAAAAQAQGKAHETYVRGEFEKLKTLDPELVDEKEGPKRRTEVADYLIKQGVPKQALQGISAVEMTLARKAMLFDQLQAKAATSNPPPKAAPAQTKPLARGAASAGAQDPKAKQVQTAKSRFTQSRSIDDAVALLNAMDD